VVAGGSLEGNKKQKERKEMKKYGWLFVVLAAVLLVGAGILVATSQPDMQV